MRLLFFNEFHLGVLKGDQVVDVSSVVESIPRAHPQDVMNAVIGDWQHFRPLIERAATDATAVKLDSVRVRPPLPRPTHIACMARNYMENGTRSEKPEINAFLKAASSVIGDGDTMVLPDAPASVFAGEAEIALVIGRQCHNVAASEAMQYVFGYTNFIDGSARGLPPAGNTFYQMKSFDTFCPIGPFIVTTDEVPDPHHLSVQLWNNGELMQDYNTSDMAHDIPRCIEFISAVHTLVPGDLVALGTNHLGLHPFMDGDRVELEVEGLGRLHVNVRDDLKRTWSRQTNQERQLGGETGTAVQLTGKYAKN